MLVRVTGLRTFFAPFGPNCKFYFSFPNKSNWAGCVTFSTERMTIDCHSPRKSIFRLTKHFLFFRPGEETEVLQAFWILRAAAFQYPAFNGGEPVPIPPSRWTNLWAVYWIQKVSHHAGQSPVLQNTGATPGPSCVYIWGVVCFDVSGYHTETQKASFHLSRNPLRATPLIIGTMPFLR